MTRRWLAHLLLLLLLVACGSLRGARSVTLTVDGETREILTRAVTVRDLLEEEGVTLGDNDRVKPAEPTVLEEGMAVEVTRVDIRVETEEREIPYDRRTVHDASIPAGESQLLESGINGLKELTYRVTRENGVEVDRHIIREVTLREPRTEVILVGAQQERSPTAITGTIAYIAHQNAWLMQRTSSNQRRLTHSGDLDGRVFSLSSDGAHLLYTRAPTETGESAPLNTLWVVDGSAAHADPVRLDVDGVLWAAWEPGCEVAHDGSRCRIAYTTGSPTEGNPGWRAENDLWVARPRPSTGDLIGKRQVQRPDRGGSYSWWGRTYAWSPDGRDLAYAAPDKVGVIRVYDGRARTLLQFPPYRTYAPWVWTPTVGWSPEGAYIVATLHGPPPARGEPEDSPVFDVWALSADGAITAELSSEAGMWASPTFAPQTGLIAFGRARSPYASQTSSYDLHVMDRDGSDRRQVFPSTEEMGFEYPEMAWSPTGDQLVSVYQDDLYLIDVSGPHPEVHQMTVTGGAAAVDWQPGSWDADFEQEPYDSGAGGDAPSGEDPVDDSLQDEDDDVAIPLPTVRPEDADEKFGPEIQPPEEATEAGTPTPQDDASEPVEGADEPQETPEPYDWTEDETWHPRPD
jgi:Tol biopolymer transport system component